MPPPTWIVGQVLAASDVNSWFVPLVAYKSADTNRSSTTTPSADPDLTVSVAASCNYWFEAYFYFEGSSTASQGLKFTWSVPSGATLRYHATLNDATNSPNVAGTWNATQTLVSATTGAGNAKGVALKGTLFVSTTAGSATLSWAQNVSEATAITLHAQSAIFLYRIG